MNRRLLNRYLKLVLIKNTGNTQNILTLTSDEIYFTVKVNKYMSHLKDEINVEIWNLSQKYYELLKEYDTINVYTGRETLVYNKDSKKWETSWVEHLIATQTILVVNNDKSNLTSLKTILVGSSRFRKREVKPVVIKNGISLWNALNFLAKRGAMNMKINSSLKHRVLQKPLTIQNVSSAISQILRDYPFIKIKNDIGENYDLEFDIIDNREDRKNIVISPDNGLLIKDWVSVDSNGDINFIALPSRIALKIGDGISVNSKYLNFYVNSSSNYTDKIKVEKRLEKTIQEKQKDSINFEYIIISLDYSLDVKGTWEVKVKARPRTSFNQRVIRGGI